MTDQLRIGNWPGRYNGNPHLLADYAVHSLTTHRLHALAGTEFQERHVADIVRARLGDAFDLQVSGELYVITRRDTCSLIENRPPRHLFTTKVLGLIGWREMQGHAFDFVFEPWGQRVHVLPFHAPSAVQAGDHWNMLHPRQVAASKSGFDLLGHHVRWYAAHHKDARAITLGDSNLDQHRAHWRTELEHRTGAPSLWTGHLPAGRVGDHRKGRRLIGAAHAVGMKATGTQVHNDQPKGFDHGLDIFTLEAT